MNFRKIINYLASDRFKSPFITFLSMMGIIALITVFYFMTFRHYISIPNTGELEIYSIRIEKQEIVDSKPYVAVSWYTNQQSTSSYELMNSQKRIRFSDDEYKILHREGFLMVEGDFAKKCTIKIIAKNKNGEIEETIFNFTTLSPIKKPEVTFE